MTEPSAAVNEGDSMLANAVRFLQDPQVQQSALSKRIAFLESKGLSKAQIDQALSMAGVSTTDSSAVTTVPPPIPNLPVSVRHLSNGPSSFDWHRLMLYVALLTSTGVALSQTIVSVMPNFRMELGFILRLEMDSARIYAHKSTFTG